MQGAHHNHMYKSQTLAGLGQGGPLVLGSKVTSL